MKRCLMFFVVILIGESTYAQVMPPCGVDYGSAADETNISTQMRYGSIAMARDAINQAKNTRGTSLGCPQQAVTYMTPDFTEPLLSDIENVWNTIHAPAITSFTVNCPRIGRYESNSALGAYYAMQAGYFSDASKLAEIANMMYDQQYAQWNVASPDNRNEGVYGYINVPDVDQCYPGGVVGSSVSTLCATLPSYCVNYTGGQFAGKSFAISGQDDINNWFDGGLAYDHGWVGVQMMEASIMQSDPLLQLKYNSSVELAGQFAISEYSVKNHNYTAKLIWLLAELYARTGNVIYKDELNYKLDKNLIPGVLWDANNDGLVDETAPPIAFNTLTTIAQIPGRMWDGHNAISWYHAMNTWALTEAYVAFRDQGDAARANELKPYVIGMMDNLANEINTLGVITPDALGSRDIAYALLLGIWKISQYENEPHLNWENAAWAMWNSGYFNTYNTHSVCVGLFLLVKSSTVYQPLHLRNQVVSSVSYVVEPPLSIQLSPNPTADVMTIELTSCGYIKKQIRYRIIDVKGRAVLEGELKSTSTTIELCGIKNGIYTAAFFDHSKFIESIQFVKH